ncbi:MAG: MoxR family ATPase [Bacteroidetes bacterium]|nr:MAG: MoxR family ATPase [Bacteroidota bacterium]
MSIKIQKLDIPKFSSDRYILEDKLKNAVEVAIALGQPLLLTGEPGTGKTLLAHKVAAELSKTYPEFAGEPLVFNTKTTSSARDLFYTYDALSHFQAANVKKEDKNPATTADFIELQALGRAIAQTDPAKVNQAKFKTQLETNPQSTVVLIDEIDKAPRDFTNDILNEIENYRFSIKEQENFEIVKGDERQIVVIMTSNSEKNLPDAFLRRCVFFNIEFPEDKLGEIVKANLGSGTKFTGKALDEMLKVFKAIRSTAVRKSPATAELVSWLRILEISGYLEQDPEAQKQQILDNLSILVKTQEDLRAVEDMLRKM